MIRSLNVADIAELEEVQNATLPGSLPTLFGSRFFRLYHESLMNDARFSCVGFFVEARLVGFLSYSGDSGALFPTVLRRHLARYFAVAAGSLLVRPSRVSAMLKLVPGLAAPARQPGSDVPAELLSFGVLPEFRRRSAFFREQKRLISSELLEHAFAALRAGGAKRVKIFIQQENVNPSIHRFYREKGFRLLGQVHRFGTDCDLLVREL